MAPVSVPGNFWKLRASRTSAFKRCGGVRTTFKTVLKLASKPLCAQNHYSSSLQRYLRSKSLLELASKPLRAQNRAFERCGEVLKTFKIIAQAAEGCSKCSKPLLKLASQPLRAQNHFSSLLQRFFAIRSTAEACFKAALHAK